MYNSSSVRAWTHYQRKFHSVCVEAASVSVSRVKKAAAACGATSAVQLLLSEARGGVGARSNRFFQTRRQRRIDVVRLCLSSNKATGGRMLSLNGRLSLLTHKTQNKHLLQVADVLVSRNADIVTPPSLAWICLKA